MPKSKCIFVIGMHRSGTSSITGTLQLMGCPLGSKLLGPFRDNPKGFFENERIWKANQTFLEECGSSWDDPFLSAIPSPPSPQLLETYRSEIEKIILDEFSDEPLFAIKDPRLCILFPIWKEVFHRLDIATPCIIALRHPFESAGSLQKRNGFSMERGLIMWINHMLQAEVVTRDCARVFTLFDNLLNNPITELQRISQGLQINFPISTEEISGKITSFLDRELKHHIHHNFPKTNHLITQILEYYQFLCQAAENDSLPTDLQAMTDQLRSHFDQITTLFYNEDIAKLFHINKSQKRQLEKINRELEEQSKLLREESTARSSMENMVQHMQRTKTWRLTELLRTIFFRYPKH